MNSKAPQNLPLNDLVTSLAVENVWEYPLASVSTCKDVAGQTHQTLQAPLEFPSIESAIVAGDRVALAIDPNVPQVDEVVTGILKTLAMTEAGDIDIVLWDEASESTTESIRDAAGDSVHVEIHDSTKRESLRYLAADKDARPIYLNRLLVDADFVLPVVASRTMDAAGRHDLTGVFPSLADAATRGRHRRRMIDVETAEDDETLQIPWLLGVHLVVAVQANREGSVGEVIAGTPDAIRTRFAVETPTSDTFPTQAELVIASVDGDRQQQTWANAARALAAASRYVASGGTIVLWTSIDESPRGDLARLDDIDDPESILLGDADQAIDLEQEPDGDNEAELDFAHWDPHRSVAATFARVMSEHRVLMRSALPRESIEPIGLGVVEDELQLIHMGKSFDSCGILRSAQFADSTVDSPHRSSHTQPSDD